MLSTVTCNLTPEEHNIGYQTKPRFTDQRNVKHIAYVTVHHAAPRVSERLRVPDISRGTITGATVLQWPMPMKVVIT